MRSGKICGVDDALFILGIKAHLTAMGDLMRSLALALFAGGLIASVSQPANATIVQYSYVGMPFAVQSGAPPSVTHMSGWFDINSVLVPTPTPSAPYDITSAVTAFSFTDGNQTLTNTNTSSDTFQVTLDSSGTMIEPWNITIGDASSGPGFSIYAYSGSMCADTTRGADGYYATIQCYSGVNNAGTWTGPSSVVGTPMPIAPSLAFFVPALIGLGAVGRRNPRA